MVLDVPFKFKENITCKVVKLGDEYGFIEFLLTDENSHIVTPGAGLMLEMADTEVDFFVKINFILFCYDTLLIVAIFN